MGAIDTPSFFTDHAYYRVFLLVHWSGLIWSVWSGSDQAKFRTPDIPFGFYVT
jgi:hypothetical protein